MMLDVEGKSSCIYVIYVSVVSCMVENIRIKKCNFYFSGKDFKNLHVAILGILRCHI